MTIYHFNYMVLKTEVCDGLKDCVSDLHVLSSDVDGIEGADDLFGDYMRYEHDVAMEASYDILKYGIDPEDEVKSSALCDTYSVLSFEEFLEFKKAEKRYDEFKDRLGG